MLNPQRLLWGASLQHSLPYQDALVVKECVRERVFSGSAALCVCAERRVP